MARLGKYLCVCLVGILAVSSMLMVKPADAQSIPIPEFTLKIVARPFNIPPVTTTNPYNGQTTITSEGYYVANVSVDITIKNQPPYTTNYLDGIDVWYQVQFKGAYQTNWQTYHAPVHNTVEYTDYIFQQMGDYTVISVPIKSNDPVNFEGEHSGSITNFPEGGKVDFQVRALIGHPYVKQSGLMGDMAYFDGETGDWSNTQTITIPSNTGSISITPNPTTPYVPIIPPSITSNDSTQITIQLSFTNLLLVGGIAVAVLLAVVLSTVLLIRHRKTARLD